MAETKRKPGRPPGSKNKKNTESKGKESKAKARAKEIQAERKADRRVIDEIWSIIAIAIGVFLIVAVFTESAGAVGTVIGDTLKGILGFIAYVLPFYIILYGILLFAKKTVHISLKSTALVFLVLAMLTVMNSARYIDGDNLELTAEILKNFYADGVKLEGGGFIGMTLATLLIKWFGEAGCWIFAFTVLFASLLLLINTPVSRFISKIADKREERRLVKENAHLDVLSEEKEDMQISMSSYVGRKPGFGFGFGGGNKNQQKVLNSSVLDEPVKNLGEPSEDSKIQSVNNDLIVHIAGNNNQTAESGDTNEELAMVTAPKREYVPPSQVEPLSPAKKNSILKYMQDDTLFNRNVKEGSSVGLEEKADYGHGFGLDGTKKPEPAKKEEEKHFGFGFNFSKKQVELDLNESSYDISRNQQLESQSTGTRIVSKSSEEAGTPAAKLPDKITNKEAREAMLTVEELNEVKKPVKVYKMPPINLLTKAVGGARTNENVLRAKAMKLEETLKNFHVDAKVVQVTQGPTVTRYEIQPAIGVKVSSIVRLSDDIALNLEAKSIRMEAPIPGKAAVGIEVENDAVTMVKLREIIDSKEFKGAKSKISFAVGKDISGNAIVGDLKEMPHLLIAGSTGSGKSVCINSIILSLLYKAKPEEVKLILIDPKVVELGNYNGIPHLMIPVVTDPTKAAAALNWAVAEMTDRYKKFAEAGVRDLSSYNESVRADEEEDKVMPQIVIIIDELADLMMAAPSQIEDSICRLAQMARAAGMHLIVATQRPSVDVITGVIKANIPSRIAFAVSSQVDSRTILDMQGAEKLVGKGDMLFNPQGMGKPIRVQGAFVSDSEVREVIQFVKGQVEDASYNEEILTRIEKTSTQGASDDADELLPEAIDLVVRSGQASVSMLQRRFRIGYNRAARIVDMMEARGIIGPQDGSRPRQVLMSEEELDAMENFQE